ncbi:hypothetical protein ACP70R_049601 [Stipagrostis hirtigluma subsp. patula]
MNSCLPDCVAAARPAPLLVALRIPLPRDGETHRHRGLDCR